MAGLGVSRLLGCLLVNLQPFGSRDADDSRWLGSNSVGFLSTFDVFSLAPFNLVSLIFD